MTPDEVEEALLGIEGEDAHYLQTRDGGYHVFLGQTADGRLLAMVGEYRGDGDLYVFAARDMNAREQRRYRGQ
ncbi:MAG: hypothetical protein ACREM2_06170 [Vulcanimicrobiaceae bacterium]